MHCRRSLHGGERAGQDKHLRGWTGHTTVANYPFVEPERPGEQPFAGRSNPNERIALVAACPHLEAGEAFC